MTGWNLVLLCGLLAGVPPAATAPPALHLQGPQFFALSVADAAAEARWYQEILGLAVQRDFRPPGTAIHVVLLKSDVLMIELLQHGDAKPLTQAPDRYLVHGLFKVGFTVPDLEAAVRALKAKGVAFSYDIAKDPATGLRFAICKDAEGNEIQIFSSR
jgi:lactoylglutathione lyase